MAYTIGQYNHTQASHDDETFLEPILSGAASRLEDTSGQFADECVKDLTLTNSNYYYFRCQIKRRSEDQKFSIKLINYENGKEQNQFIKDININAGDREEWVDISFIFNPIITFDTILFELDRTTFDYNNYQRTPKIAYQQIGIIKNVINNKIGYGINLLKIGVQGQYGLSICINGNEIRINRTGIFELKNGIIPVYFFSVVAPAIENNTSVSDLNSVVGWEKAINSEIEAIERNGSLTPEEKGNLYKNINSKIFFGTSKTYKINDFILDYMYEEKEE